MAELDGQKYYSVSLQEQLEKLKKEHVKKEKEMSAQIETLQGSVQIKDRFIQELEK